MTVRRRPEVRRLIAGLALVLLGSDGALAASEPAATVHPDLGRQRHPEG